MERAAGSARACESAMTGEKLEGGNAVRPRRGTCCACQRLRDPLAVLAVRCLYRKGIRRRAATDLPAP